MFAMAISRFAIYVSAQFTVKLKFMLADGVDASELLTEYAFTVIV